mmetsp:Transcript_30827/g.50918  ORF Transcript_30827/g.50918 Transcript_30827/m.50918 type:complete len:230 (+) Transcript_30827:137-826(+)
MLTVDAFKKVASGFKTHKEQSGESEPQEILTGAEIKELKLQYSFLNKDLFQQILVVRKEHRKHVTTMLQDLVAFREQNGWKLLIHEADLHDGVRASGAHSVGVTSDSMPLVYMKLRKVDTNVASPKDFQHQGQYAIQEASKLHDKGEVALTLDFEDVSFGILRKLSSQDLSRGMDIFGKFPVKLKRVYVVNDSICTRIVMKAVLSFASKQVQSKIIFASSTKEDDGKAQ